MTHVILLPKVLMVTPAVYPHMVVNYGFSYFPRIKIDPINLESENREFPNQSSGKSDLGFMNYDRTDKQTDRQRLQLYIDIYMPF